MFYYISGTLAHKSMGFAVIDAGGVGYRMTVSQNTYDKLPLAGNPAKLYNYLAVREDGIELFGFYDETELSSFQMLITVSGVGPKAAMSILSLLTPEKFALAVCTEDTKAISKASGIGPKTAARIVLELKDKLMKDIYYVTENRRKLAVDCSISTVNAAKLLEPSDLSLYVGIPFCPTRCAYCSFVSRTVGKKTELLEPYLAALTKEIEVTGKLLASSGKRVRTIYIGGGTPTTLSTPQMTQLLDTITGAFDMSRCIEFTVEGGRPDTLTPEKLSAIRRHGADRMSINPQTMMDPVLRACGRPHTAADVLEAYRWAETAGFTDINMDLIAGLPTDDFDGFKHSLDTVIGLDPANITVHTLAIKKGAKFVRIVMMCMTAALIIKLIIDYV